MRGQPAAFLQPAAFFLKFMYVLEKRTAQKFWSLLAQTPYAGQAAAFLPLESSPTGGKPWMVQAGRTLVCALGFETLQHASPFFPAASFSSLAGDGGDPGGGQAGGRRPARPRLPRGRPPPPPRPSAGRGVATRSRVVLFVAAWVCEAVGLMGRWVAMHGRENRLVCVDAYTHL